METKINPSCIFCYSEINLEEMKDYEGKHIGWICNDCLMFEKFGDLYDEDKENGTNTETD